LILAPKAALHGHLDQVGRVYETEAAAVWLLAVDSTGKNPNGEHDKRAMRR
jgi:hypothetical protein